MQILYQLGLNQTFWYQLVFFLISAVFLNFFLFRPYLRILELRKKSTVGATESAAHLVAATEELALDFEGKIRSQNEKVNSIFSDFKKQGALEEEKILADARARAHEISAQTQSQITKEIASAKQDLSSQIPTLAGAIASKVLGRELGK